MRVLRAPIVSLKLRSNPPIVLTYDGTWSSFEVIRRIVFELLASTLVTEKWAQHPRKIGDSFEESNLLAIEVSFRKAEEEQVFEEPPKDLMGASKP